jgi:putative restriction endonuclease
VEAVHQQEDRFGKVQLIRPRLGQGAFRTSVAEAYQRQCALTGEHTFPVLEAAHIRPYCENGPHEISNGLLLRSDFHTLFDTGLVTITPDYRVEVSERIRDQWNNGKRYYERHGQRLVQLPSDANDRPREEWLRWHNENVYVG